MVKIEVVISVEVKVCHVMSGRGIPILCESSSARAVYEEYLMFWVIVRVVLVGNAVTTFELRYQCDAVVGGEDVGKV